MELENGRVVVTYSLDRATRDRLAQMSEETRRTPGRMIDAIVDEAWRQFELARLEKSVTASLPVDPHS